MSIHDMPLLNAILNGTSAILLVSGYRFIRQGRRDAHRNCMVSAVITSSLFLASYITYHALAGRTEFHNPAWFRPWYLVLLTSHTILAVVILPLIFFVLRGVWRKDFVVHKKFARWTFPLWLYVSVTGVLVYLILYQIFPQTPVS